MKVRLSIQSGACDLPIKQTTNTELTAHLSSIKKPGQTEISEIKALTARAINAERRLTNAQNQLLAAEEKIATMNQKVTASDDKWEARVKEYEARQKVMQEQVKRERQGGKERISELEGTVK